MSPFNSPSGKDLFHLNHLNHLNHYTILFIALIFAAVLFAFSLHPAPKIVEGHGGQGARGSRSFGSAVIGSTTLAYNPMIVDYDGYYAQDDPYYYRPIYVTPYGYPPPYYTPALNYASTLKPFPKAAGFSPVVTQAPQLSLKPNIPYYY